MKRAAAAFVVLAIATLHGQSRATVYEHARLIDGNGGPAAENASFVVVDGTFAQVGRVTAPKDAAHVDLSGKTVMPALVDAHVHLGYRKGTTFTADNFTRENITSQLQQFSYWGVSGVMSTGTDVGDLIFPLRAETAAPSWGGTIIRTAWRGIAAPDGGPFPPMRAAPFGAKTEAEARADVRELAAKKADMVKIWVDDRNGTVPKLSPAIYGAIIDEAHTHGLRVIAHAMTLDDTKALLRAHIDGFAHLFRDRDADAEVLDLLKSRPGTFFMVTMWAPRHAAMTAPPAWADDPRLRETATAEQIQQFKDGFRNRTPQSVAPAVEELTHLQHNVVALGSAGATLILGTDAGGNTGGPLFGWSEHIELQYMADAGMTPAAVIRAATKLSSATLKIGQLGAIAPGKRADFLVLNTNPLDDIRNTRDIFRVSQHGVTIRRH